GANIGLASCDTDLDPLNGCFSSDTFSTPTADCSGIPGGSLELDECGECGGSGIADGACDCDGNVDLGCGCGEAGPSGCDNACGSTLENDECGVCGGDDTSCADCAGVPNGPNTEDNCGVCDDDASNDCVQDCAGIWGGSAYEDDCGICDDDTENDNADMDCAGMCFGDAELDDCGVCEGENADMDCTGECFGTAEIDECGVCGGPGYFECGDGSLVCSEEECPVGLDYCLELHSGANLVSFHALLEDASITNMMSSIEGNATGVIGEGVAANYNETLGWMGSLNTISPKSGYWIKVNESDQLCLEGAIPTDPTIVYELHSGTNLISFPAEGAVAIPDALPDDVEPFITGIIGEGVAANNNPSLGWMGSLSALSGGKGYWMITTQAISFSFDTSTMSRIRKEDQVILTAPDGLELYQSTHQAFYFIEDIMVEGEPIQRGDWVMAYHENTLVGAREWNGNFTDIPAMGFDGSVETIDYCNNQAALTLRVVKKDTPDISYYVVETLPKWEEMGMQTLPSLSAKMLPSESILVSAYPNPFNPVTSIQFGIGEEGMVNIAVYDISGRLIDNLTNQTYLPGYHSVQWNADNVASGIYFLTIRTNGVSKIQKLILMK
ncbi:MAG: T9SS type A sorting domain-containing protein, partial [Candidatus Marinimicrobia bacterium]|nr:T9SS type A sorting domain-containing protein [Candidatus Neomarinimicrobiota bacterium]